MSQKTSELLKQEFIEKRGYWNEFWEGLLTLDPEFFTAYLKFSSIPWSPGVLEPKVKEFIYIAIDAATTHLYEPGLRIHIENAFKYGATKEEIMEVYQLTSVLGMHTCTVSDIIDEMKKLGSQLVKIHSILVAAANFKYRKSINEITIVCCFTYRVM